MTTAIVRVSRVASLGIDETFFLGSKVVKQTASLYLESFGRYLHFAGNVESALQVATLNRWVADMTINTTYAATTINRHIMGVRAVIKRTWRLGYVPASLVEEFKQVEGVNVRSIKDEREAQGIKVSPTRPHNRTKIEPADMRRITSAPDATRLSGKMHRALLSTLASSGCRINEVCTLTQEQIVQGGSRSGSVAYKLRIMGKGEDDFGDRYLSVESYGLIQEWVAARAAAGVTSEYVFTAFAGRGDSRLSDKPLSTAGAWQLVQRYADQVGLTHIKPHDFRRFMGTQLAAIDIRLAQKALGHKRIETTAKHYVLDELELGLTDNLY